MTWDPGQYLRFGEARLRPGMELLARIPADDPAVVVDLGCGAGQPTAQLRRRWPRAEVLGIDSSAEMLEQAGHLEALGIHLLHADIATWEPEGAVDVIYSNAALQWLGNHEELFARLWSWLRPGGVLAVQMPRNQQEPSHTCAFELAREDRWRDRLLPLLREEPVAPPQAYARWLADAAPLDIWETTYLQMLTGARPVLEWTRGSMMGPLLAALDASERPAFETAYAACVGAAYPPLADGRTPFAFRRLFVVAVRPAAR